MIILYEKYGARPLVILIAVFVALVISALYRFFSRKEFVRRRLRSTPKKKIGEVVNGEFVRITGSAVFAGNYFDAPLSKRKCVYYRIVAEEYHNSRRSMYGNWRTVIDSEEAADVVLQDGAHYAVIDSKNTKGYLLPDRNYATHSGKKLGPQFTEFLSWFDQKPKSWMGDWRVLRFSEGVIEPNERVTVCGIGEWKDASEFDFDLPVKRILVLKPKLDNSIYLSDDPEMMVDK